MHKMAIMQSTLQKCFLVCVLSALTGCASMLPEGQRETKTPWDSYAAGQAMFAKIIPGKTTLAELKVLGIDPGQTPNVALLGHADLLRRLVATSSFDITRIDAGLQACASDAYSCSAYEIVQTFTERKRIGNFLPDFFNFRRKVDVTGWQFDALVVVKDEIVIYKLWSGNPKIHQVEDDRNPLGPLQGMGSGP
jgi:hypothetical protein